MSDAGKKLQARGSSMELMVKCVNAHDRCYGGAGGSCEYCEPQLPLRTKDGRFTSVKSQDGGNMDAPERIWVTEQPSITRMGACHIHKLTGATEYIRADLAATDAQTKLVRCAECDCDSGGEECTWIK